MTVLQIIRFTQTARVYLPTVFWFIEDSLESESVYCMSLSVNDTERIVYCQEIQLQKKEKQHLYQKVTQIYIYI